MTSTNLPAMLHQRTLSNLSSTEDLFSSITGLDDLAGDDDLSFDDVDDSLDGGDRKPGSGPAKKGKSRASSTAEKKATHNAVERARRESLNARFLVLADMLPGMTQVKRASKAAIVNKSIDLIRELQTTENKLAKENEALKAELEALRLRTGSPASASSAAGVAALAAQEAAARQASMHPQHALYPGMQHPLQLSMPMMPHLPAAAMAASMAAAAAAAAGNPAMQQTHVAQQQQQQAAAAQLHASQSLASAAGPPSAEMGSHLFPGIFTGLFNAGGAFDSLESARSESGSPASHGSQASQHSSAAPFAHGLFDLPAMKAFTADSNNAAAATATSTGSPASGYNNSPPGTVASLAGSERTSQSQNSTSAISSGLTHNGAPSPASSNGVPTPPSNNAYSPLGLNAITATPQSSHAQPHGASNSAQDPVIAAFDGSADAAYLAAQFAPNDLAKAQHDLQAFIAYQQRMAFASAAATQQPQQPHTPTLEHGQQQRQPSVGQMSPASALFPPSSAGNGAFVYPQQQQQQNHHLTSLPTFGNNAISGMCGPSAQAGMPSWQMMMAQHQAMVAAYGQQF